MHSRCVPTGANVNFCYNGNNDKALKNQSCLTGALHIVTSDIADSRDRLSTTLSFSEIDSQQIDTLSDGMEKGELFLFILVLIFLRVLLYDRHSSSK